jgi:hypothetical protein
MKRLIIRSPAGIRRVRSRAPETVVAAQDLNRVADQRKRLVEQFRVEAGRNEGKPDAGSA